MGMMIDGRSAATLPFSVSPSVAVQPSPTPPPTSVRHAIEDEIDRLIALLDAFDGDCDCEPDVDDEPCGDLEPSLGWISTEAGTACVGDSDCEREDWQ